MLINWVDRRLCCLKLPVEKCDKYIYIAIAVNLPNNFGAKLRISPKYFYRVEIIFKVEDTAFFTKAHTRRNFNSTSISSGFWERAHLGALKTRGPDTATL